MKNEITVKFERVKKYLAEKNLDGIVLASRINFSWFTCGALNYVNASSDLGEGFLFITPDKYVCVSNNIDGNRIEDEELKQRGIEVIQPKWFDNDAKAKTWNKLIGDRKIAADINITGMTAQPLPCDFVQLRYQLSDAEVSKYKELGDLASRALETAAKNLEKGMTELEIAGLISNNFFKNHVRPWVILVAVDERIKKYRHPIPTDTKLDKIAQLVICGEKFGLICSCTRLVSFGPLDDELKKRHKAVVNIDLAFNNSTKPGKKFSEVFAIGKNAYEVNGYADEWQLHHQGGPAGYGPRDGLANDQTHDIVLSNQGFAWNPSITGTKSEDTIVATESGPLFITHPVDWPVIEAEWNGAKLDRADILVR